MIDLSIIIASFNTKELIKDCLESVVKNTKGLKYEIIVVDNASSDGSQSAVSSFKDAVSKFTLIQNNKNLGFAKANNQGLKKARGKFVLLLNSDTLVEKNILGEMIVWLKRNPNVGIASCALRNKDGSMQGTGGYFPTLLRAISWMTIQGLPFVDYFIKPFHPMHRRSLFKSASFYNKKRELDWVTGAFLLMRREVYENVGPLDEDYFMYTEDVDYCYRAKKAGWKVYYLPDWSIVHHGGASGKSWSHVYLEYEGVKLFYRKHYPAWQYPLLRLSLKIGALGRMVIFGIIKGKEPAKAYVKVFRKA